ncbi:MAG: efflux RND transporter permease subunit [Alphaproteobacteria bacterium]
MFLRSLIGLFVRHRTASNLLMALMLVAGVFSLFRLNTQFWPDIGIDMITVRIVWPGASAADVEANIVRALEPEVRFQNSVKRVIGHAVEGAATVIVEFEPGTEMQAALSDIVSAVGRITTFPEDSERPIVRRVVRYDTISRLVVSGAMPEAALKSFAERIREDLLARGIDRVELFGARDEEIWVEVAAGTLRRLDLTLADIAARIGASSQDLPSGSVEGAFEKQIRSLGLAMDAKAVGAIEVRALDNGEKIYLRDIARISDTFEEAGKVGRRRGQPAIELHVQRATSADALVVARTVDRYLEEIRPTLPQSLELEQFDVRASLIRDRIKLLLRNGAGGLVLVLIVLFVFLNARVAVWVAAGIPVALLATLAVMYLSGQSINMVSLFALIMTLGIIVDDAIVVGEHAAHLRATGMAPIPAAETGATRMLAPVIASSLTTIAAFLPIFMITDIIGQVISAIPFVAVSVLLASLVECFLVLPGHLRGALRLVEQRRTGFRRWFDGRFERFRAGRFRRGVAWCLRWRYLCFSSAIAVLILCFGLVIGGRVPFVFFPTPESDAILVNFSFAPGTPRAQTQAMIDEVERALGQAEEALTEGRGGLVVMSLGRIGRAVAREGIMRLSGDNLGSLHVELAPSDFREVRTAEFIADWRRRIRPLPGLDRLALTEVVGGPPGREIDIRFIGGTPEALKAAALEVRALLARFPGISDIEDDLPYGKQEVVLSVTPRGHAMGFSTQSVARQVRHAFEGAIAKRFARGNDEVTVRVQYPRGEVDLTALSDLYLRGPGGAEVPLSEVVEVREKAGFARIRREDGVRQVAITAEVDNDVTNGREVRERLRVQGLPEIAERYDLGFTLKGRAEEEARTLADMRTGAAVGLVAIYIILAWVFSSYSRPIVVMLIIPFGLVGAILGHLVMGFDLTILSLIALLGLAGILVNNSIILVSTIDERLARGEPLHEAIVGGAQDRLRAVILTSLTTIGGLLPLMSETSLQAQFLIPMAITLVFGLAVAALLVLIVVPVFLAILDDLARLVGLRGGLRPEVASGD